jgi:nucleotide-binding universal stress UspA family protein
MMRTMSSNGGVHTEPVRRVMVGTDRSQTAERAVRWAASFAELYTADSTSCRDPARNPA